MKPFFDGENLPQSHCNCSPITLQLFPNHTATVPQSRCNCSPITLQLFPNHIATVAQSHCNCSPITLQLGNTRKIPKFSAHTICTYHAKEKSCHHLCERVLPQNDAATTHQTCHNQSDGEPRGRVELQSESKGNKPTGKGSYGGGVSRNLPPHIDQRT